MCGRYRRTTREEELARIYRIPIPSQPDLPISYNIAPSQEVLAIRFNPETKQRSLDRLRWGLVPYWPKDEKIGFKTINARAETVDTAAPQREVSKSADQGWRSRPGQLHASVGTLGNLEPKRLFTRFWPIAGRSSHLETMTVTIASE
jgi:hypothetical protein